MKIYFVRHAEVIEKYQGKYNGHIDIPLSQKGKKDAALLGKKLNKIVFDKVYCSDLLRARETLHAMQIDAPIVYTTALREKFWGESEGKSFEELQALGKKYTTFLDWIKQLGGERIWRFFQEEILTQNAMNILVVTHAGVIKSFIALEKKITLEESFSYSLEYNSFVVYDTDKGFVV